MSSISPPQSPHQQEQLPCTTTGTSSTDTTAAIATTDVATTATDDKKRRVRVSEAEPAVFGEGNSLTEKEYTESWWSATDFAEVKDSVKRQCRDHRQSRRYSDCLTQAYRSACSLAARAEDEGEDEHRHGVEEGTAAPTPEQTDEQKKAPPDEGLVRWLEDEGPRGLEGYSSRLHALRRQRHLQETKHAVFLEQARQNISRERDDELLARQASMASRRARTFATLLGQADAWAAKNDSEGDERAEATETEGRLSYQPLREVSEELECPRPTPHRTSADKTGAATADTITTTDTTPPENRERVSE